MEDLYVSGGIYYQNFFLPLPHTGHPTVPPTPIPTSSPTPSPYSCNSYASMGVTTSGVYSISPVPGAVYDVYCDLETDGGGWMLTYAYNHVAEAVVPVVPNTIPTDPATGYSHADVNFFTGYSESDVLDVRFFCTTTGHSRVMHFKTSNAMVAGISFDSDQTGNLAQYWNSGFTALDGHTAVLPAGATGAYTDAGNGFWNFPFYMGDKHWAIAHGNYIWSCDDYNWGPYGNGHQYATQHLVYVRLSQS